MYYSIVKYFLSSSNKIVNELCRVLEFQQSEIKIYQICLKIVREKKLSLAELAELAFHNSALWVNLLRYCVCHTDKAVRGISETSKTPLPGLNYVFFLFKAVDIYITNIWDTLFLKRVFR